MLHTFVALVQDKPGVLTQVASGLRKIVLAFLCAAALHSSGVAQGNMQVLSVAGARQNAGQLGSKQILVKGHFWWGKEGSMIYDSYYKAILKLQYSDAFNAKHRGLKFFLPEPRRKSDLATVTGRLRLETNGQPVLVADDIQFSENPR